VFEITPGEEKISRLAENAFQAEKPLTFTLSKWTGHVDDALIPSYNKTKLLVSTYQDYNVCQVFTLLITMR